MKRLWWIGAAVVLLSGAGRLAAQGPGGAQMDPAQRQRMEAMKKWFTAHENTFKLSGTVVALGEMDKGTKCPLTPAQAKKAVAVVTPLKKQPKLTQEQAKAALKGIKAAIGSNTKQLNELSRLLQEQEKKRGSRRGGPGGGAPGARSGGGAPGARSGGGTPGGRSGGTRTPFDPAKMKDFNPFLPPKPGDESAARRAKPLQEAIAQLEKKSKQKK